MTDKLKQTIKEEVGKLPKENQEVINTFGWEKISEEIGKKYLLTENEINDLQVETLLILVGLEDPDFYANNIENNVGASKDEANKISTEVFEKILTPINDAMIENIKKSGVSKNANAEQNLNFILSGGDYSAFLEKLVPPPLSGEDRGEVFNSPHPNPLLKGEGEKIPTTPILTPTLADIKNNTQKINLPIKPMKITDIKSKFNI